MSADGRGIDPMIAAKLKIPGKGLKGLTTAAVQVPKTARPMLPNSKSFQERRGLVGSGSAGASGKGEDKERVKTDWLVILPDHVGVLEKRMGVRQQHLAGVAPGAESGFWKVGGATLDEPFEEGKPPQINGSCMIARASSKEEVLEELKKDVYTTSGVWDWDKVQIWPFKAAFYKGD